jgi:single-stranded DNA-specific DHH superfamily exonuclease
VIGIVASRIVDRFCKPPIMIAFNENNGNGVIGRAAGRSIAGSTSPRAWKMRRAARGVWRARDGGGSENPAGEISRIFDGVSARTR